MSLRPSGISTARRGNGRTDMASIAPPSHTRRAGLTTDSWITPKRIIDILGPFDLDPCACDPQPWPTAQRMITEREDGLSVHWPWSSFVWMNPPYGRALGTWIERLAKHNNGIALVFARTDTSALFTWVWPYASCLLFVRGRITFCTPDGNPPPNGHNSGGPSVLIGYGHTAETRLYGASRLLGKFVSLKA